MSARLLEKLQELHTNGPAPYNHGICTQLSRHLTIRESRYMSHLMQQWPGRSGYAKFPVLLIEQTQAIKLLITSIWKATQSRCGTATLSMVSCVGNC